MSKEKTTEERAGFATGVLNMAIFHIGWSLFKQENWIVAFTIVWKYMKPTKDTKANIKIKIGKKRKENE